MVRLGQFVDPTSSRALEQDGYVFSLPLEVVRRRQGIERATSRLFQSILGVWQDHNRRLHRFLLVFVIDRMVYMDNLMRLLAKGYGKSCGLVEGRGELDRTV